ncbi:MAG TPA: TetR/AcrR family transcriptional regulator [Opitutaceae bacterium]|jgi:AcrR family transcriptional regulator
MIAAAATSDRIRAAALEILESEGPGSVSMRRIAGALGITPMAIYHHFRNKEALLHAIVDQEFAKFHETVERIPPSGPHGKRLLSILDAYVLYAFRRPRIFDYVFSERRPDARRYPEHFRARGSPTLNQLADAVSAAMDDGHLRRADVWEVSLGIWAHVHGFVALSRAGRFSLSQPDFLALVHRSIKRLLDGLRNP